MLPNLNIPSYTIYGPLKVHPFGFLVAVALITGSQLGILRARKVGLDLKIFADAECCSPPVPAEGKSWGAIKELYEN